MHLLALRRVTQASVDLIGQFKLLRSNLLAPPAPYYWLHELRRSVVYGSLGAASSDGAVCQQRMHGLSLAGAAIRDMCDFLQKQDDPGDALTQLITALLAENRACLVSRVCPTVAPC